MLVSTNVQNKYSDRWCFDSLYLELFFLHIEGTACSTCPHCSGFIANCWINSIVVGTLDKYLLKHMSTLTIILNFQQYSPSVRNFKRYINVINLEYVARRSSQGFKTVEFASPTYLFTGTGGYTGCWHTLHQRISVQNGNRLRLHLTSP